MNKFEKTYLEIINQNNIVNQGVGDFFTKLFKLDTFQSAADSLNSVTADTITESGSGEGGKGVCQAKANEFIQAVPLFEKCKIKLEKLGTNIGNKIKQKSENILVKGKNGDKQIQGLSKKTAGGAKAGIKMGLKEEYDEKIKSHTNRQLIMQDTEKVPKHLFEETDKKVVNQFKLFVEECAVMGVTPNQLFNINARRAKQKPIVFEDVTYTFKPTKTSLICQKKYTKSNKTIVYENVTLTNNTTIKTYQSGKLIFEQTAEQPKEDSSIKDTVNATAAGAAGAGTVMAVAKTAGKAGGALKGVGGKILAAFKGFISKIWQILELIITQTLKILLTVILSVIKMILQIIYIIFPKAKNFLKPLFGKVFNNPSITAAEWVNKGWSKGIVKFIMVCIFIVFCVLIYTLLSDKNGDQQKNTAPAAAPENTNNPTTQLDPDNTGTTSDTSSTTTTGSQGTEKAGDEEHDGRADDIM